MQDVDSEICDAVDVGSKIKLKDSRDGKLYTVVKYDLSGTNSFGACWMYDHLALGKPTEFTTLTPDDSDVTENFSLPPTVATWPNNMYTAFAWINISSTDEQGYLYSANTATANSMATVVGSSDYPVDNYYVASQSICPKNWTLPRSYYVTGDQSFNTEKALWDAVQPTSLTSSSYYSYGPSYEADAKIKNFYSSFIPGFYGYIYSTNTYIENSGRSTNYWTKDFIKSNEGTNNYQNTYYTYHYKNSNNLEMYASYSDTWKSGYSVKCMIPVSYTKKSYSINYYVSQYPGYTQSATDRVSIRSDEPQEYTIRAPGSITVKRAGYRLVGWSTTSDATTAEYANGDVYTFPENSSSLNLYSVWEQISEDTPVTFDEAFEAAGKEKYNGYYKMQDITPEICDAVANGQSGRLIDVRDDKVYWVARLTSLYDDNHDGVCWMTQNLNFHLSTEGTALSPETSDVLKAKVFHASATTGSAKSALNADDYYLDYGGLTFQNSEYQNMSNLERTKNVSELEVDDVRWHYSLGTYYGLAAAYAQDDYSDYMNFPLPEDREESVCPKGWQIPNALASGTSYYTSVQFPKSRSFLELNYNLQSMNGAYNEKHFQDPFYATASGYLSGGANYTFEELMTRGWFSSYGYSPYYWTGNMYSNNYAYIVNMYSGTRDSDLEDYRMRYYSGINSSDYSPYYNMSIRCVARF
jgi:uncharacterized protein (TIGR02145 family)